LAPKDPVQAGFYFLLECRAFQGLRAGKLGTDLSKDEVAYLALRIAPLVRALLGCARNTLPRLGDRGWDFLRASGFFLGRFQRGKLVRQLHRTFSTAWTM